MRVFEGAHQFDGLLRGALTIGVFDGLHLGHQKLARETLEKAKNPTCPSIIYTFQPHPLEVLQPELQVQRMFSIQMLMNQCKLLGFDYFIFEKFSKDFAKLDYEIFFKEYVFKILNPSYIIVGYDFRFGLNREGSIEKLKKWQNDFNFKLITVEPVKINGKIVSSTILRQAFEDSDLKSVHRLMGRPLQVKGTVISGQGLARKLGFPTANIQTSYLLPKIGVYTCKMRVGGELKSGVMNIGTCPTVNSHNQTRSSNNASFSGSKTQPSIPLKVEVHLLGLVQENLLGKRVEIEIFSKVRDEQKFDSLEELSSAIKCDVKKAREFFR